MGLFRKSESTSAFLKMGLMGFPGSGKTYTATAVAIGLVHHMRERKVPGAERPIYFLDTETGSDWVAPMVRKAGLELFTAKTRAFSDLSSALAEAEKEASILLIDSITHFWVEFCDAYARKKGRARGLEFQDWAYLKKEWRAKFTDRYVNSPLHIIMCGRAGHEYDHYVDDAGKKQIEKTGVKMKAEGELGFEPSLLVLMEREQDAETHKLNHVAYVMKDRRTDEKTLDGKKLLNPTFASFLPHIDFLNLGGQQLGVDTSRTSDADIPADAGRDTTSIRREIETELIQATFVEHMPGRSDADKKRKVDLLQQCFGTRSWTEIEKLMPLDDLRAGHAKLKEVFTSRPASEPHSEPEPKARTEVAEPDDRDVITSDIIKVVSSAVNKTRLSEALKAQQSAMNALDAPRLAKVHAAIAVRRQQLSAVNAQAAE